MLVEFTGNIDAVLVGRVSISNSATLGSDVQREKSFPLSLSQFILLIFIFIVISELTADDRFERKNAFPRIVTLRERLKTLTRSMIKNFQKILLIFNVLTFFLKR